jgi:phospholipid N-methyltransferase
MIIIEKCEKKAGVFTGARTYRLVLNEQGLYILELGKAMGYRNESNFIADKILDKIQENREKQQAEKEKEFNSVDLDRLVDGKKNFLIKKTDVKEVKISNLNMIPKLDIKSSTLNITLHFWQEDRANVEKVYEYLK